MEKNYVYFTSIEPRPWPVMVMENFGSHVSKSYFIYFQQGDEKEEEFVQLCSELGIDLRKKTLRQCTGRDLCNHPYYYLLVPYNGEIICDEAMDYSSACRICGVGPTMVGAKQVRKMRIDSLKVNPKHDIFDVVGPSNGLVITRRLYEILLNSNLTGFQLVPCLEEGRSYSSDDEVFSFENSQLLNEANYFQLVITEETLNPPYCGEISDFVRVCRNCNTHNGYYTSINEYFNKDDLKKVDFQFCHECISSNMGRILNRWYTKIISSRTLNVFIFNKVKLEISIADPLIRYQVVEIS